MERATYNAFHDGWELFRSFMCCGGRRFYTRKERLEQLEKLKTQLQHELLGIEEMIADLKKAESK